MRTIRRHALFMTVLVFILSTLLLTACSLPLLRNSARDDTQPSGPYPMTLKDSRGEEVTLDHEPQKIVAIGPSITEILFAIGAADRLVGVDNYSDYPPEAASIEKVGDVNGLDYEKIAQLQPDLVITLVLQDGVSQLEQLGFPVYVQDPQNLDEVVETMRALGQLLNLSSAADKVANDLSSGVEEVSTRVASIEEGQRVTVFYEVWSDPLITAGPGSFIADIIKTAGGINVGDSADQPWATFSAEAVVEANPDVIITPFQESYDELTSGKRAAWNDISAVKNGRVYLIDQNVISRPSPRLLEGLRAVARFLYPERFQ